MKQLIFTIALACLTSSCIAQVEWTFRCLKVSNDMYEIHMKAELADSWHIYAQDSPKGGPVPTKIIFNPNPMLGLIGTVKEIGNRKREYNSVFNVYVLSYRDSVDFTQLVKVKSKIQTSISGVISFMVCNESQCMPPAKQKISFELK
ncbi:protein-disulfide reductase DsbD domain-containing protein [Mucilaginibacter paludis]|uniref:Uncharacterized protein n=1 Tax=Mucilaginibacter paludis DSM 18603 TaxID=714943 RepID=H1Y3G5_9SPHI|nr:protein-disulfide reductase DsbD domain-containing protein [Mucilaginibacter paludis]EHQ29733.1 hypothetical protein Mucpa_5664 [Mucilaginibacter paludis DSM 18603]